MKTLNTEEINIPNLEAKENPRIKGIHNQNKIYQTMAIATGASAAISAIVVTSNLALGDTGAIYCLGSGLAMAFYTTGYIRHIKNNNLEIKACEDSQGLTTIKTTLIKLKHQLERAKINKTNNTLATAGFSLSALLSIISYLNAEDLQRKVSSILIFTLSSLVTLTDILFTKNLNSKIETATADIEYYETIDRIEDSFKEGKEPEEELVKKLKEQMKNR